MSAWISMSAQLAVIFSHGIQGFGGELRGVNHLSLSPPSLSTHPEQTGLNPFHQSDLREKHSSIPEERSHIYRSSGNRRKLMKCRLELRRKRGLQCGTNKTPKQVPRKTEKSTNDFVLACFFNQLLIGV